MKPLQHESLASAAEMTASIVDVGFMGYQKAHELQLACVENQLQDARASESILIVEHPPVYTLGSSADLTSLMRSREEIEAAGIDIIRTERGGDITYHGPGQLVVYPIVNLRRRGLKVTEFVSLLEEIMLKTAADFGIVAGRDTRNRGIWVGNNKLGSIGIRIRHGISFHGLAINVNLSLEHFSWIQPCGLQGVSMTSLQIERGEAVSMEEAKTSMKKHITEQLSCREEA